MPERFQQRSTQPTDEDSESHVYAPHETRMLALEMAVEFINGDKRPVKYDPKEVIDAARVFEAYLTSKPIKGYES